MAKRYWVVSWKTCYAGTDNTQTVDLCEFLAVTETKVKALTDVFAQEIMDAYAWERAIELIESWAEPKP